MLGACCDLFFNIAKLKNRYLSSVLAIYTNYTLFAILITYVFRYDHWVEAGLSKVANHIFLGGTLAALGCALVIPLCHSFGRWLQDGKLHPAWATSFARMHLATIVTTGMWLFALIVFASHGSHM